MYGPYLPDGSGRYTYRSLPYAYHNKNPVAIANTTQAINNAYYVQGSLFLDVSLLDNLIWETRGGLSYSSSKTKDFRPTVPQYWWFTGEYATDLDVGSKGLDVADETYIHPILYSQLTYSKSFGDHNFKILAGWQDEYFKDETLGGFRQGFPSNLLRELNAGSPDGQTTRGSAYEWALLSFYGRLNYNYKNKYLLEANIRKDGSSRFAKENRWGTFPSISAGWRISEESFLKNVSWLSNLKFRASWGRLGNQNIGNYPYQEVLDLGYPYPFDYSSVTQGVIPSGLVDPDIRWETTEAFDVGADLSLFSNKLNFSIDWFRKMTYDILREAQVPAYFGLSAPTINGGKMKNVGWEFVLNYKNSIGKLNYKISGNFQTFKNTVVKFGAKSIGGTTIIEEGRPWETFYLYDWIGIFQSQNEIDKSPKQPYSPKPGDLKFRDVNGDGVINADDRTYFSGAFPDFTYSLNLNASFKHFDLSALFYGVQGRNYYVNAWGLEPFFQSNPPTVDWKNAWTENNHTNSMPHIYVQGYPPIDNMASTYFLKDASYLRLRNVQLGYSIPESVLDNIFIKSLRLYFSGENLFIITDYPWLDPERGGNGRFVNYPQNRVFNFGIDVTF
jgi:TonB-linked SusC/RagA family outer membrane protein